MRTCWESAACIISRVFGGPTKRVELSLRVVTIFIMPDIAYTPLNNDGLSSLLPRPTTLLYKPPRSWLLCTLVWLVVVSFVGFHCLIWTDFAWVRVLQRLHGDAGHAHLGLTSFNPTITYQREAASHNHTAECVVPELNPWDPTLLAYIDPSYNPLKGCKPKFTMRSWLQDGMLGFNQSASEIAAGERCAYRCWWAAGDNDAREGSWTAVEPGRVARPECDVLDAHCAYDSLNTTSYKFMHTQIYPSKASPTTKPPSGAFDLHILMFDATSMSAGRRTLQTTFKYLREQMGSFEFPHLNRVGLNSRPNAYAFLMGERGEPMPENPWSQANNNARGEEICNKGVDDENILFYDYTKLGYRSLLVEGDMTLQANICNPDTNFTLHCVESQALNLNNQIANASSSDWSIGVFNWPNCVSFKQPPVTHFMKQAVCCPTNYINHFRPWAFRMDGKGADPDYKRRVTSDLCIEHHTRMLDMLSEFLSIYPGEPKVSMQWFTNAAHDNVNGLFHIDDELQTFIEKHQEKFDNSFLIIQGDHGIRTGGLRSTRVGEMEENNPMLVMTLPRRLRNNTDLRRQLETNSREMISHFDLYSTFLEMAKESANWTDTTKLSSSLFKPRDRQLRGSSLFHPLPQPRNCETLLIPFQYCNCQHNSTFTRHSNISLDIAQLVVDRINDIIITTGYSDRCALLTVDTKCTLETTLEEFRPVNGKRVFRGRLCVHPSGGHYDSYAELKNNTLSLVSTEFPRRNGFADDIRTCLTSYDWQVTNYCMCKDLIPTSPLPATSPAVS